MRMQPLLIILGPTASGKTQLALEIAKERPAEIISADSRQVFKGMDIGTGKDLWAYKAAGVSFHLIDHYEAGEKYHVDQFKKDFYQALNTISAKGKLPVLCGGTGMYIHSILQNHIYTAVPVNQALRDQLASLDKLSLQQMLEEYPYPLRVHADHSSLKRLIRAIEVADYLQYHDLPPANVQPVHPLVIGLSDDVVTRREKIAIRLDRRLEEGLIEEVEGLLAKGVSPEMLTFYGLEYKFVTAYLQHEMDYQTFKERLYTAICQFAKRQMTFFRKMEKDGVYIHWLDAGDLPEVLKEKALKLITQHFGLAYNLF